MKVSRARPLLEIHCQILESGRSLERYHHFLLTSAHNALRGASDCILNFLVKPIFPCSFRSFWQLGFPRSAV